MVENFKESICHIPRLFSYNELHGLGIAFTFVLFDIGAIRNPNANDSNDELGFHIL